jgi:NAD(P)-dependent dehydrogenase (short-subunit alcohol dehydrogenase family)
VSTDRVLVTGASRGIGRATARALAERGHRVTGTCRDPDSVGEPPEGVRLIRLDLVDEESIESCIAEAGDVDVLINNAGRSQIGAAEEIPLHDVRDDFQVNLFGPMRLIQGVLPGMRSRGRGTIVNVGSMVGRFAIPFQSVYTASKFALAGYSWALRSEVRPFGVRVVVVEPNDIATSIEPRLHRPEGSGYAGALDRVRSARSGRMARAHDPAVVARRIVRIVESRDPAPFHVVGGSGPLLVFLKRLLPERTVERLVRGSYGLERPPAHRPRSR